MKLLQAFTLPARLTTLAAALVMAALAAPALALESKNLCYDSKGRAMEVPAHFLSRFTDNTPRAPVSPLNPDGMNCKPLPVGGNPTLCNRNGVVIAGRMSGGECVTLAQPGDCYHKGQLIDSVHWNVTNPGLLRTDTSIPLAHRYYDSSGHAHFDNFAAGLLRRDRAGNCLPAPQGFCYGSLVEGGTTNHYLMKSVTRPGSYEPTCIP